MQLLLLKTLGWLVAHTPEPLLQGFSAAVGDFIFFVLRGRRRLILSNLDHAFPDEFPWPQNIVNFPRKSHAERRALGRESCRRLIETGLLSLATPYLTPERYREIITAAPSLLACYTEHRAQPQATIIASPHLAYWEAQTAMPLVVPGEFPEFGIIYRPLDNAAADALVKGSRERFGMKLLSRKDGFAEALKILRRRGFVGILFDQNAGMQGALTTLFGRVCSTTELPGLMTQKFAARVYGIFPRRLGFWRVEIGVDRIEHDGTSESVTIGLNRWLEQKLSDDANLCASWLWAHDRWRHQDMPAQRLRLESRRNLLADDLRLRGWSALPRRTRIWVRLPNWLGDVVMAMPLLRALMASRPDAMVALVTKFQFRSLFASWPVGLRFIFLPDQRRGYFRRFWRKNREQYPDCYVLFTNSFRGDLEARLTGARQRFGIVRPGKPRPLLSHAYRLPADFDERSHHQLELWENFLHHFGLEKTALDRSPVPFAKIARTSVIGLIPGSENTPEKRWPVAHWRALIESLPQERFVVFGTPKDAPIAQAVADGFAPDRVENSAGKTDLDEFAARLLSCRALVTNDTGGMHLANALGVPLVALFGPTNPVRTGPVFSGPTTILQPPGCAPSGGGSLADLAPAQVAEALRRLQPLAPSAP